LTKISPPLRKIIGIAAVVIIVGIVLAFFYGSWILKFLFLGRSEFSRAEILLYFSITAGGIVLLGMLIFGIQRLYFRRQSHRIQAQNDFNSRFKNASTLLYHEDTNLTLVGIYTLHQIAIEASSEVKKQRYVAVIKNLLCSFLRKNSEGFDAEEEKTNKEITRKKPEMVFQMVIDLLFRSSDTPIYNETRTHLTGIALNSLNFRKAQLRKAQLSRADLGRADLGRANLIEANLTGADLSETHLSGALLNRSDLSGANLNRANLHRVILHGANLSEANLKNANLKKASLNRANLNNANLSEANLIETHLNEVDLSEANLTKADLMGAKLSEANLSETNLSEANLSGVTLTNADLSRTNLRGTKLWFANLSGSKLKYTDFSQALIGENTDFTDTIHAGKTLEEIRGYTPPPQK
jgi:uncharacterized protein YjbI with pentapeptide repeats